MLGLPKRHAVRDNATESPQVERPGSTAGGSPVPEVPPSGGPGPSGAPDGQPPEASPAPEASPTAEASPAPEAPTAAIDSIAWPPRSRRPGDAGASEAPDAPATQAPLIEAPAAPAAPDPGDAPATQAPLTEAPAAPAAPDPGVPIVEPGVAAAEQPNVRHRAQLRRRVRFLRRRRELELRDLGGLVFDLTRFGTQRPDLVQAKVEVLGTTDAERRSLEQALGEDRPLRELREAGIGGVCPACGTLYASDARFCSSCGAPLAAPGP